MSSIFKKNVTYSSFKKGLTLTSLNSSLIPVLVIHGFRETRAVTSSLNLWSDLKLQKLFLIILFFLISDATDAQSSGGSDGGKKHFSYKVQFILSAIHLSSFSNKSLRENFVPRLCLSENQFFVTTKVTFLYSHNNSGRHQN